MLQLPGDHTNRIEIDLGELTQKIRKVRRDDDFNETDLNYFKALTEHFQKKSHIQAASIYFEHPTQGVDFEEDVYKAIVLSVIDVFQHSITIVLGLETALVKGTGVYFGYFC